MREIQTRITLNTDPFYAVQMIFVRGKWNIFHVLLNNHCISSFRSKPHHIFIKTSRRQRKEERKKAKKAQVLRDLKEQFWFWKYNLNLNIPREASDSQLFLSSIYTLQIYETLLTNYFMVIYTMQHYATARPKRRCYARKKHFSDLEE